MCTLVICVCLYWLPSLTGMRWCRCVRASVLYSVRRTTGFVKQVMEIRTIVLYPIHDHLSTSATLLLSWSLMAGWRRDGFKFRLVLHVMLTFFLWYMAYLCKQSQILDLWMTLFKATHMGDAPTLQPSYKRTGPSLSSVLTSSTLPAGTVPFLRTFWI